jgi:hypothetical protein
MKQRLLSPGQELTLYCQLKCRCGVTLEEQGIGQEAEQTWIPYIPVLDTLTAARQTVGMATALS